MRKKTTRAKFISKSLIFVILCAKKKFEDAKS